MDASGLNSAAATAKVAITTAIGVAYGNVAKGIAEVALGNPLLLTQIASMGEKKENGSITEADYATLIQTITNIGIGVALAGGATIALPYTALWGMTNAFLFLYKNRDQLDRLYEWLNMGLFKHPPERPLSDTIKSFFDNTKIRPERDPLAIDLDGDGIETVGLPAGQTPVLFDHDADGTKTGTGWLKSDDAWLVLDRNGNGTIDSGRELFGADTSITTKDLIAGLSSAQERTVTRFAYNGFEALRNLDTNNDGVFDKNDDLFAKVQLWQDFNQDGVSQANELSALADKNILKINLTPSASTTTLGNGNSISGTAQVVRTTGASTHIDSVSLVSTANNLNLATSEFYRTFEPIPLTNTARGLPDMGGSGWVRDLRESMSLGNTASGALTDVISRFAAGKTRNVQMGLVDELLKDWALSSSKVSPIGLVTPVKEIIVAEAGQTRTLRVTTLNPDELAALQANTMVTYPAMHLTFEDQAYMSAPLGNLPRGGLTPEALEILDKLSVVEVFTGQRYFDYTTSQYIGSSGSGGGSGGGGAQSTGPDVRYSAIMWPEHILAIKQAYEALRESVYSTLVVQTRLQPYLSTIELSIDDARIHFHLDVLLSKLQQAYSNDATNGLTDLIELNRYAQSTLATVNFDGMSLLRQWVESIPPGSSLISTLAELNVFQSSKATYSLTKHDDILFGNDAQSIIDMGDGNDLADGGDADDLISGGDGQDTMAGQYGYDTIYGGTGADVISGGGNPDRLYGEDGCDILDGGTGNDLLIGGSGADTYLYGFGDGQDVINNGDSDAEGEQPDTLLFKDGIKASDVTLRRQVDDLLIIIGIGSKDTIRVSQHFANEGFSNNRLDKIQFADGTTWAADDFKARTLWSTDLADSLTGHASNDSINGGAGRDSLYGGWGNDTLDGGQGNDWLDGGNGADTYWFGLGSGNDTINNADAEALGVNPDTLRFGPGISPGNVALSQVDGNLVIQVLGADDQLTISRYFQQEAGPSLIESMVFDTGETWSIDAVKAKVLAGTARADQLRAYNGSSEIHGGDGKDLIWGGRFSDSLEGGADSDQIWGGDGDDTLDGGSGNDTLDGGSGSDVYQFGRGSGRDYISPEGGGLSQDTLAFKAGIKSEDVSISASGSDLSISINGTTDQIGISYYFYDPLKAITFSDGTVWGLADIRSRMGESTDGADSLLSFYASSVLSGGRGNDSLLGSDDTNDTLRGDAGNDVLNGMGQSDSLSGGVGNDELHGGRGNDTLLGDQGNDSLWGDAGNDTLDGGSGEDWLSGGSGSDTYVFARGSGQDRISNANYDAPGSNPDTISIENGLLPMDLTFLRKGADLLIRINDTSDQLTVENHFAQPNPYTYTAIDFIKFSNGTSLNAADVQRMVLTAPSDLNMLGSAQNDSLAGASGNDYLEGLDGADTLDGGKGNDYLTGGNGNDTYLFGKGSGQDTVNNHDATPGKSDSIVIKPGTLAQDVKIARHGDNLEVSITGTSDKLLVQGHFSDAEGASNQISQIKFADNTIWDLSVIKAKALASTGGDDKLYGGSTNDTLSGSAGDDFLSGMSGNDVLMGDTGNDTIQGDVGNDEIHGGAQCDQLDGGDGKDILYGEDGNDTLMGGNDDDVLDGGAGNDLLDGGLGNDAYKFTRGSGNDTILSGGADMDAIEFSAGIKTTDLTLTRKDSNGLLIRIAGTSDSIFMSQYFTDQAPSGQLLKFSDGTVWAAADLMSKSLVGSDLPDQLIGSVVDDTINGGAEGDDIDGKAGNDSLMGGSGADFLNGNSGNDTLNGGTGDDTLYGDTGSDVYRFDLGSGNDVISDNKGNDINVIELGPNILSTNTAVRQDANGSLLLTFTNSTDTLLVVSGQIDQIRFSNGTVWDEATIKAKSLQFTDRNDAIRGLASADILNGGKGDDSLYGNAGSDTLDGGAGDDLLDGGLGQDVYLFGIGSGQDTITEYYMDTDNPDVIKLGPGISSSDVRLTRSGSDATLSIQGLTDALKISSFFPAYSNVSYGKIARFDFSDGTSWGQTEINSHFLMAGGGSNDISIGLGNNSITGSDDNDYITAGNGDDTIRGGLGKDLIYGGNGGDQLWGGRMDDELRGESDNDYLYGDIGQDLLDGGVGNDVLNGGAGADTYEFIIGSGSDTVSDNDAALPNIDVISLGISPTDAIDMQRKGNHLVLSYGAGDVITVLDQFSGDAFEIEQIKFNDGTIWDEAAIKSRVITNGEEGGDTLIGYNDGTNHINGLGGNDAITGGAWADVLQGGTGHDTLDGGIGNDTLHGNAGDDWLLGGQGVDSMVGGDGYDLYTVDNSADVVVELFDINNGSAGGSDTVYAAADYVLPDNVEMLVLGGDANLNAWSNNAGGQLYGNDGRNHLHGGSWDDLLSGGGGIDTLSGGDGDDFYELIDGDGNDVIVETVDGGYDFVWTYTSDAITMADNVEEAVHKITGLFGMNATGNALDNVMTGSGGTNDKINGGAGNDTLRGLSGVDVLRGGLGDDSLEGGSGGDRYMYAKGDGRDVILDRQSIVGAADYLTFEGSVQSSQLWFARDANNLVVSLIGTTDAVTIKGWYASVNYQIESIKALGDNKSLSNTKVDQLVQAMAGMNPPPQGQTTLSAAAQSQLGQVLAASWA